jgi:hypothetical protein
VKLLKRWILAAALAAFYVSVAHADSKISALSSCGALDASTDEFLVSENATTNCKTTGTAIASVVFAQNAANLTLATGGALRTATSSGNTALLRAYDVDNTQYVTFGTLTAGNTPTFNLSNDVTINSAYIYRAGGNDVGYADGGTGITWVDPNADQIFFWDDSAGSFAGLTVGSGLSISGTTITASGGSLSDGDKGDITVSSSGAAWAIDNDVVTYAKMQNVSATDRLLGRDTAGAGDVEELTAAAVRTILNVADGATAYTDELAQDAAGAMIADTSSVDITYTDATPELKADVKSDGITEAMLKAVDAASDEECLTYETTTGDFEWQTCGSGGGIGSVADDTSPQLGGDLDTNTFSVVFSTGTGVRTGTTATNTALLQAYDVDDTTYRTFATLTAGNTPSLAISAPAGGSLSITANLTGNASTATALAANGGNCSSGSAPLGVDASGAVESCFDVWTEAENTAAAYAPLASPVFTGIVTLPSAAAPTTDADGEIAVDLDGWGTGFDAIEVFNGTASAYIPAITASDTCSNGQVPKFNTGGEWTCENDSTGGVPTAITVADTTDSTSFCGLFESATGDLGPKTDAGCTYNASNGTLTATAFSGPLTGNVTGSSTDLSCTDCIGETEISDVYLLNNGDVGTGVYDFGGASSFEITNGTAPTVDAAGEIAIDTNTDGSIITHGSPVFFDGTTSRYVVSVENNSGGMPTGTRDEILVYRDSSNAFVFSPLSFTSGIINDVSIGTPADGDVLTWDDINGYWTNVAPSGGPGAVTWDAIGDAAGTGSVNFSGFDQDITSSEDGGDILTITNTDVDQAADSIMLRLATNDTSDANTIFIRGTTDDDGTPITDWNVAPTGTVGGLTQTLGSAGVRLTTDGDGAITFLGLGNGSDEDLTVNLDDTANSVVWSSSTGVTEFDLGTIDLNTDTIDLTGTGTINGLDAIDSTSETTLEAALDIGGDVTSTGLGSTNIAAGVIVNADINAAAAIAWSKIATAGAIVNADISSSAAIAHSKMATALKTIYVPAVAVRPTTTSGCAPIAATEISSSQPEILSVNCDAASDEKFQFSWVPPKGWNNGTVTFAVYWSHAATATNFDVVWAMECLAVSNDDAIGAAYGTAVTVTDTGGTTNDLYVTPTSGALTIGGTPADADMVTCRGYRDADNVSDTLAIDARFMGVAIFYTQTTEDDT